MEGVEETSISFPVKYVASFMVNGEDQEKRLDCVHIHLEAMKRSKNIVHPISLDSNATAQLRFFQRAIDNSKSVLLDLSSDGIRVRSADAEIVHMVHALRRISYATCDPDSCQFAFSARQPSSSSSSSSSTADGSKNVELSSTSSSPAVSRRHHQHPLPGVLYCHVFLTESSVQAKEINDYVSRIFREAERRPPNNRETIYYEFPPSATMMAERKNGHDEEERRSNGFLRDDQRSNGGYSIPNYDEMPNGFARGGRNEPPPFGLVPNGGSQRSEENRDEEDSNGREEQFIDDDERGAENEDDLRRRNEEKRFADLCQMLVASSDEPSNGFAMNHQPINNRKSPSDQSESRYYWSHEIVPQSSALIKKTPSPRGLVDRSIESSPADRYYSSASSSSCSPGRLRRSKFLGSANLEQPLVVGNGHINLESVSRLSIGVENGRINGNRTNGLLIENHRSDGDNRTTLADSPRFIFDPRSNSNRIDRPIAGEINSSQQHIDRRLSFDRDFFDSNGGDHQRIIDSIGRKFVDSAHLEFNNNNDDVSNPSPLRPESKRQKRRPLSAVITDFAGGRSKKQSTSSKDQDDMSWSQRRGSMMERVPERNEGSKNGSILRRLLQLKIGGGSSLRLSLLNNNNNEHKNSQSPKSQHNDARQRPTSQSVRFLSSNLDRMNRDHSGSIDFDRDQQQFGGHQTASSSNLLSSNGDLKLAPNRRRRRPLSAVFPPQHQQQRGNGSIDFGATDGNSNSNGGGMESSSKKSSGGGGAKSAMSKMFGFTSSSRRKSRSSAQLDSSTSSKCRVALSNDLDSIPPNDSNNLRRFASYNQHRRNRDDTTQTWMVEETNGGEVMTAGNSITHHQCEPSAASTLMLGSGVGCGEQCSISMPNLRYGLDHSLPLSMEEESRLNGAAWYYGTVSRQLAAQVLELEPEGAFVVRRSTSQPATSSSLVLSIRVPYTYNPSGVSHYLILHTTKGFKLKGFTKDFPSVHALITHHSFMCEQLPCRLIFTDRTSTPERSPINRSVLFNASSSSDLRPFHHQFHQNGGGNNSSSSFQLKKSSNHSRHSSPYIGRRHDLVTVAEQEESIYGKLPSPPPPPEQASSALFAALKIADAKVF